MCFHHLLGGKATPSYPDTWCPSWRSLKVGCLPVYTLFEFASSQRRLPVSTNRPQERPKARAGGFREEALRTAILPPCNARVEIYVDSWSQGRTQGTEAKFPGPWALICLCPPCPDPLLREARSISPSLYPDLAARLRRAPPLPPSRAVPVPLPAQGSLPSAGPQPEEARGSASRRCPPGGRPHPCAAGGAGGRAAGEGLRRGGGCHSRTHAGGMQTAGLPCGHVSAPPTEVGAQVPSLWALGASQAADERRCRLTLSWPHPLAAAACRVVADREGREAAAGGGARGAPAEWAAAPRGAGLWPLRLGGAAPARRLAAQGQTVTPSATGPPLRADMPPPGKSLELNQEHWTESPEIQVFIQHPHGKSREGRLGWWTQGTWALFLQGAAFQGQAHFFVSGFGSIPVFLPQAESQADASYIHQTKRRAAVWRRE